MTARTSGKSARQKIKKSIRTVKKAFGRPHKCGKCSKAFPTVSARNQHENLHTDLFKCVPCGQRSSSAAALRNHQKRCWEKKKRDQANKRKLTDENRMSTASAIKIEKEESANELHNEEDSIPLRELLNRNLRRIKQEEGAQQTGFEVNDSMNFDAGDLFQLPMESLEINTDEDVPLAELYRTLRELNISNKELKQDVRELGQKFSAEIEKKNQELAEAQKKQFDQVLDLLKNKPKNHRRLIPKESDSSDDELSERTPENNRLQARKTISQRNKSGEKTPEQNRVEARKARRERKKHIQKKNAEKSPEEAKAVEELPSITQEDFGIKTRCAWCWCTDHSSDDCSNYKDMKWRLVFKENRFLCNLCLVFHPGRICFVSPPCPHCPEKGHHPAICLSEAHQLFLEQLP